MRWYSLICPYIIDQSHVLQDDEIRKDGVGSKRDAKAKVGWGESGDGERQDFLKLKNGKLMIALSKH